MLDLVTAIDTRASALKLQDRPPGAGELERILLAGVRAPDLGRLSPWRFVVLQGESRQVLGDALAAFRLRKNPEAGADALRAERQKALRAPVIVVAATNGAEHPKVPAIEQAMAVSASVQNMILTAHALGFGTMWKTGDAAYDPEVKERLGLAAGAQIVAFLYLGTASAPGTPRNLTLDGVVRFL